MSVIDGDIIIFKKDIDQFRFGDNFQRFKGENPHEHQEPPFPPPFRGLPPFGPFISFQGQHFKFPLPISREFFQEIRDYMILLIISEYPNGITGYQLQEKYNFPRGTLVKTLQDLENKGYLYTKEEIIDGRANKFYIITDEGKKFLEQLKLKWANIFGKMAEINPPEGLKTMIFTKISEFESLDDAKDFFRGIRSWVKGMLQRIERRIKKFNKTKEDLDELIEKIDKMDHLDRDKIKELVNESIKKIKEEFNNE
ncbi:MAG: helix-turn-helix transcriptional regulator [Promethearchaeota archaeon]